jgi:hypothetical protein
MEKDNKNLDAQEKNPFDYFLQSSVGLPSY